MKRITQAELDEILRKHKMWLNNEEGGKRADLRGVDLRNSDFGYVDLRNSDLRNSDLRGVDLRGADLRDADLRNSDLRGVDLRNSDLRGVDLRGADLRDANIDYSCLPLWCGSLSAHFDDRQLVQIAYHLVKAGLQSKNASLETKKELSKLIEFANKFHRVEDCGKIEWSEQSND